MKSCVSFPEEAFLIVRPCLTRICLDCRPAAKLLSVLLYRYSLRQESKEDAENLNAIKVARGQLPDQDTTYKIYRKQEQLVKDACGELTEKTMHDVAVPTLQLLGFLDIEEQPGRHCYIVHIDCVQAALNAYKQGTKALEAFFQTIPQLEKVLIRVQLEKVLINKKYFLLQLELFLIGNRKSSNCKRGRKPTAEAAGDGKMEKGENLKELTKKITKRKEGASPDGSASLSLFPAESTFEEPPTEEKPKPLILKEKTEQVKRWIEEEIGRVAWISSFEKAAIALAKADATRADVHVTVEHLKTGWWADKISPEVIAKHFTLRTAETPPVALPSANTRYSSGGSKPPLKKYNVEELRRKRKELGVQALSPSENIFLRAHDDEDESPTSHAS